jgi:hypothetical protein
MRTAFGAALAVCAVGTWVLVTRVVPIGTRASVPTPVTGPVAVVVD